MIISRKFGKDTLVARQKGCSPQKWNCDSVWNKSGTAIVFRTRSVKHKRSLRATWSINSACTRTKRKHNSSPMMSTLDQKTIDSRPAERSISQVSSDSYLSARALAKLRDQARTEVRRLHLLSHISEL